MNGDSELLQEIDLNDEEERRRSLSLIRNRHTNRDDASHNVVGENSSDILLEYPTYLRPVAWLRSKLESLSHATWFLYASAFFVVIASVLGTGILGLPVELGLSGFWPFFATYSVCFVMQALVICFMVELLQRTKAVQKSDMAHVIEGADDLVRSMPLDTFASNESESGGGGGDVSVPMRDAQTIVDDNDDILLQQNDDGVGDGAEATLEEGPDLHTMGTLFLGVYSRKIFDAAVMLHFTSILISYGIAGAQAYGDLLGIDARYLIAPFVVLLTLLCIFGSVVLQPVISVMTFLKGSLLVLMVLMTAIVGMQVQNETTDRWLYTGRSFLIGTVALGGAINVLPVVFAKLRWQRRTMINFMRACVAGLFVVFLLNIFWCYYILRIVPQTGVGKNTLMYAEGEGQISTVPLIGVIDQGYPQFAWVSTLINVFIVLSITVSYITLGTGLKHVLDGLLKNWNQSLAAASSSSSSASASAALHHRRTFAARMRGHWRAFKSSARRLSIAVTARGRQFLMYALAYGIVLLFALANPKAFLTVLTSVTSLALNLESGVFIAWMYGVARSLKGRLFAIPYPLHRYVANSRWIVMFYFVFAVVYDGALIVANLISPDQISGGMAAG
jgi:amino acid permease